MANNIALINGKAFDYTDIVVTLLGVPIVGIKSINYTDEQTKENNMGTGNVPVSRGQGPINSSGSLEISMNDVEALRDVAPNGSLVRLPSFDIVITFLNEQRIITHELISCEFTNDGVETSQGDTDVARAFGLIIGEIRYRP